MKVYRGYEIEVGKAKGWAEAELMASKPSLELHSKARRPWHELGLIRKFYKEQLGVVTLPPHQNSP